ncbi:MAG: prolipoprotein diacylglyceryl transferase [Bacilli bacterium]|nr:prolipoprotein diacylglyceryl transferase [Bacilli bacterium]
MYPKLFGVIETYSVMLILGILAAMFLFEFYFRKILKEPGKLVFYLETSLIIAIMVGLIGAYLTQNLYDFIEDPSHYHWSWSLTFYGGLIFGVGCFFLLYFVWARKHYPGSWEKILWIAPSSISLAHAIGRVGCFLAGCCYGVPTDAWYGIQFQTTTTKVVPTNLFEAIFLFALFGVLFFLAVKKHCPYGPSIYLITYGIWRFIIEFFRGDHRGSFIPGLTPSQAWSIALILLGIGYLIFRLLIRKKKQETQAPEQNS